MKSTAMDRVIASTAPLLIEYANLSTRPISEAIEARLRIAPAPAFFIRGATAREQRNNPLTLTA